MKPAISIGIILPSAGKGLRFGSSTPKQYLPLGNRSVLAHSVATCLAVSGCTAVIIASDDMERCRAILQADGIDDTRVLVVDGGTERQHSVRNAVMHPAMDTVDVILVHDAVRPAASPALFTSIAEASLIHGAAVPVLPVIDTIKVVSEDIVVSTPPRSSLRRVQTPQGSQRELLRNAFAKAHADGYLGTDDASLLEHDGVAVVCVPGEETNIKITNAGDIGIICNYLSL